MSAATATSDLPPPSRSGRLLSLVRKLVDYGNQLIVALRPRLPSKDNTDLVCAFGTSNVILILARIALGMKRAGFLADKITLTAASIDAGPQPEPEPSPRAPRAVPCEPKPRAPRLAGFG